jgi:tRNA-dihydrouridine synthase 3
VREGRELAPTAAERVAIMRQLVAYMKEHFQDDARGKRAAFVFLPFHMNWFSRYRHVIGVAGRQACFEYTCAA